MHSGSGLDSICNGSFAGQAKEERKRKTKIKQNIIQQFRLLQKERIIENDIKLLKKNKSFITTQELTIQDINSAFLIVYYEVFKEK